jgi:hypothetical protein
VGLSAGLILVVGAVVLAGQANSVVQKSLNDVTTSSLASARLNVDTRTIAEQAKAAEDRTLLQPSLGDATWTGLSTELTKLLKTLPDQTEQGSQVEQWTKYTTAHTALVPTSATAKSDGRTTTLTPLVAFSDGSKNFASTDAGIATTTLTNAQRTQLPLGIGASAAAILALFSAVWGLNRRLAEYV